MKGQTLIEALAALAVAVSVVSAVTIAAINSLNNVQFSKNQNLATSYAQQGMEIVRRIRNRNWTDFYAKDSVIAYCLAKDSPTLQPGVQGATGNLPCQPNIDNFIRQVLITQRSPDCAVSNPPAPTPTPPPTNASKVTVSVFWSDNKCTSGSNLYCHEVKLVTCFSDYNIVPTP